MASALDLRSLGDRVGSAVVRSVGGSIRCSCATAILYEQKMDIRILEDGRLTSMSTVIDGSHRSKLGRFGGGVKVMVITANKGLHPGTSITIILLIIASFTILFGL